MCVCVCVRARVRACVLAQYRSVATLVISVSEHTSGQGLRFLLPWRGNADNLHLLPGDCCCQLASVRSYRD